MAPLAACCAGASSDDEGGGSSLCSEDDAGVCAICMDVPVAVLVVSCHHGLCVQCAYQLTIKGRDSICCPFCRQRIAGFMPGTPMRALGAGAGAVGTQSIEIGGRR